MLWQMERNPPIMGVIEADMLKHSEERGMPASYKSNDRAKTSPL